MPCYLQQQENKKLKKHNILDKDFQIFGRHLCSFLSSFMGNYDNTQKL